MESSSVAAMTISPITPGLMEEYTLPMLSVISSMTGIPIALMDSILEGKSPRGSK